jgi:hypothetical protein
MAGIRADDTVLSMDPILDTLTDPSQVKEFRGRSGTGPSQQLSPTTTAIRSRMTNLIQRWYDLDPAEFHTAEGLDALKQQLGDIRDGTQFGTPQRPLRAKSLASFGRRSSIRRRSTRASWKAIRRRPT